MCDHKTCKEDEFETESAEQTLELEQKKEQNDLENIDVRAEHDAPLLDTIIKAIQASSPDWETVYNLIHRAPNTYKRTIANETSFIRIIIESHLSSPSSVKKALMDELIEFTQNKSEDNTQLIIEMVYARFGVAIGSSQVRDADKKEIVKKYLEIKKERENLSETAWTFDAVKHIYQTYQKAAQATLDLIICVVTFNTHIEEIDGETFNQEAIYKIDYNGNNIEKTITDERSFLKGQNIFDRAVLHELGHIFDKKYSISSTSGRGNFRKLSDWKEYSVNDPYTLIRTYKSYMGSEYRLNPMEEEVEDRVAEILLKDDISPTQLGELIENISDEKRLTEDSKYNICESQFLRNFRNSFAKKEPWKKFEPQPGMNDVQMHEAYVGEPVWFSYSLSVAKNNKYISSYQFRSPSDEFAELFASFYLKQKEIIEHHSTQRNFEWFINNILPLNREQ